MADVIKFKRGPKSALPIKTEIGEPLYCTDTNELYIGTSEGARLLCIVKHIDCGFFEDLPFDPGEDYHCDGGLF